MLSSLVFAAVLIGDRVPPLDLTTLDGDAARLDEKRIVVIDFFATWCGPCQRSLPAVERLRARFGDRVDFVSIAEDDDVAVVRPFVEKMKMTTRVLFDRDRAAYRKLGAHTLPTTYVVADGLVERINHGYGDGYEERVTGWLNRVIRPTTDVPAQPFPIHEGETWTYAGTLERLLKQKDGKLDTHKESVSWRIHVEEVRRKGPLTFYELRGFFDDLVWLDGPPKAQRWTIVAGPGGTYHLLKPGEDARQIDDAHLLFVLPFDHTQRYACLYDKQGCRGCYCPYAGGKTAWNVTRLTNPDESTYTFEYGVGITGYRFVHHGTPYTLKLTRQRP